MFVNKIISILLIPSFLIGCMPKVDDVSTIVQPKTRPVRNMTSFSQSMECMDELFVKNRVSNRYIASENIPDRSGKLSLGVQDMLINAIAKMSRNSSSLRYLDAGIAGSGEGSNTVQVITKQIGKGLILPEVYIRGSISQVNDGAVTAHEHAGIDVMQLNASASKNVSFSTATLDLQLFDMQSRTLLPGMSASNVISISKNEIGVDVGAHIQKAGVSFDFGQNDSEDSGQAVRNLVELGTIELLGKWLKVPYWSCLSIDSTNPLAKTEIKAWYDGMNYQDRIKFFKSGLQRFGYYQGEMNSENSPELKTAITKYQVDKGLIPNGTDSFEMYESLINSGASISASNKITPVSESNLSPSVRPLEVNIVTREHHKYKINDGIVLSVSLSKAGYLHCYYEDETGVKMMIYPNDSQKKTEIPGNQPLEIPDARLKSFELKIEKAGTQSFMCMASNEDLEDLLPDYLKVASLDPISVTSLDKIVFDVKSKANGRSFGFAKKQIIVTK